jgi:hypothetical protein
MIKRVWLEHGTKALGLIGGTISAVAAVKGLIPVAWLPKLFGVISVLTFWRGFINTELLSKPDSTDEHSGV